MEKAILAIIHATKKLPHYFQAHIVFVLTQFPLKALLLKSDYTGRVVKWGAMLGAFDVKYIPRTIMKGQVFVDLVAEFIEEGVRPEEVVRVETVVVHRTWQLFVDDAAKQKGSRIGIVMISPDGITLEKSLSLSFLATNNKAEYEALLARLITMQKLKGKTLRAYCDSRLVDGQVLGD